MNNNSFSKQNLFKSENLENLTIAEVVGKMFDLTGKNGELTIEGLGGDMTTEGRCYQFKMDWDKNDCANIIGEMENFANEITEVASISDEKEQERKVLADALFQNTVDYLGTLYDGIINTLTNFSVAYARRFFKLIMLGAPEIVKNNERNRMVQAIVANRYGEWVGLV